MMKPSYTDKLEYGVALLEEHLNLDIPRYNLFFGFSLSEDYEPAYPSQLLNFLLYCPYRKTYLDAVSKAIFGKYEPYIETYDPAIIKRNLLQRSVQFMYFLDNKKPLPVTKVMRYEYSDATVEEQANVDYLFDKYCQREQWDYWHENNTAYQANKEFEKCASTKIDALDDDDDY